MRAVWVGLVGAVLASNVATAGSCRPGHVSLQGADRIFEVAEASAFKSQTSERLVLRGAVQGAPHVIDLQSVQGNSAFLTSYPGRSADTGGMPVKWSRRAERQLRSGGKIDVETGPLAGEWRISCNE